MLEATVASAVDAAASLSPKRQIVSCMNRQMAASRTISYNEASKVCRDQLKAQADGPGGSSMSAKAVNAR